MRLGHTLLGFLQLSRALQAGLELRDAGSKDVRITLQDSDSNDATKALVTDVANTRNPKEPIPWWKLPNTNNGEMNALTGQQWYPFDDGDENAGDVTASTTTAGVCPLSQCQSSGNLGNANCGPNARCIKSYCQCNLGWKPASNKQMVRGWNGLEALTVWAKTTDTGCTALCDTLSCSEVPQVKECFGGPVTTDNDKSESNEGSEQLATDGLHLGAIKAPGSDDIGGAGMAT